MFAHVIILRCGINFWGYVAQLRNGMMNKNVDLGSGWKWMWLVCRSLLILQYPRGAEGKMKIITTGRLVFGHHLIRILVELPTLPPIQRTLNKILAELPALPLIQSTLNRIIVELPALPLIQHTLNRIFAELPALPLIQHTLNRILVELPALQHPTYYEQNTLGITCITTHRKSSEDNTRGITCITTNITYHEPAEGLYYYQNMKGDLAIF